MAEFNVDDYFANRSRSVNADKLSTAMDDKFIDLQRASADKVQQLTARIAATKAAEEVNANSWVRKAGLNPNDFDGSALNLAAEVYSGTSRLAGQVAGLPHALLAGANQANLSEQDIQALNRHAQGKATSEDLVQINRKVAPTVAGDPNAQVRAQAIADLNPNAPTPLSLWTEMNKARTVSRNINEAFDRSNVVEQTARNALNAQAEAGYAANAPQIGKGVDAIKTGDFTGGAADVLAGTGKLVGSGISALVSNPRAVAGYVAENAPQLLVGAAGKAGAATMASSNVGYAADIYNQGIENYQAKNGGALPPEAERQRMILQAESLALAEQGGDMAGLAIGKVGAKAVVGGRTSIAGAVGNSAKAVGEGFLTEAPTEALQTYLEGEITGKSATGAQIYTAGLIGGASGAGLSGGMRTGHEAAVLASQPSAPKVDTPVDPTVVEAAATGKVDHLVDPTKSTYAPDTAIQALFGHSQLETTSPEDKQANLTKADEILSDLQNEREATQISLDATPESKQAKLDQYKAMLEKVPADNVSLTGKLQEAIKGAEEDLAQPGLTVAERNAATARVTQLDRLIKSSAEARDSLSSLVQPKAVVDSLVQEADQPGSVDAAEKVITLAMASPQRLTAAQATQLANNTNNALTAPQRTLLREFSAARIAENELMDLGGVSADIFTGAKNKGIAQYRANFGRALIQANKDAADLELAGLTKFEQDHTAKATAAEEALRMGLGTQILSDGQGGWSVGDRSLTPVELRKGGHLAVNSGRLVQNIQKEANALTKVLAEMQTAYANKFNVAAPGESNVKNVSQAGSTQPTQSVPKPRVEAPAVRTAPEAGSGSNTIDKGTVPNETGPRAGVESSAVEGNGVDLGTRKFNDLTDPKEKLNLYRGEGKTQIEDGAWWSFDRATAEHYAAGFGGRVLTKVMSVEDIGKQTAQGQGGSHHRVFVSKADVGVVSDKAETTPGVVASDVESTGVTATQAEYDEALRVKNSSNEADYENVSGSIAKLVTALNNEEPIKIVPVAPVTQSTETTQEANASLVEPKTTEGTETSTAKAESTEDTTLAKEGKDAPIQTKPGLDSLRKARESNKQFDGQKRGEAFRMLNKAAAWLTQKSPKSTDILASRPLVDIQDFLDKWTKGEVIPFDNEDENVALNTFRKIATDWANDIWENFIKGSLPNSKGNVVAPEWGFMDPIQDFFNEDGTMDPNVVTAVAYAAYSWFAESSGGAARQTNKGILMMHGLREGQEYSVTEEGGEVLRLMTAQQDIATASLGSRIVDVLGLQADEDAPQNYMSVVTTAFGVHALRLLEEKGLVTLESINGGELNTYIDGLDIQPTGYKKVTQDDGSIEEEPIFAQWHYVKIVRNDDLSIGGTGKQIKEASAGSQGILDKLFGATRPMREASTTPGEFTQETAKRTDRDISLEQREVLEAAQKVSHRVIPKMWDALKVLGDDVFLTAAGARNVTNDTVQYENRAAVETQNESLMLQLDRAKELVEPYTSDNKLKQAFYVTQEVWRNFRVGILTQNLNMQSSKIHRAMFFRPEWEATIALDDAVAMEQFQVGLAQALGIKVDTQPNEKTIESLNKLLFTDTDNRIVELALLLNKDIANPNNPLMSEEDKEAIGELSASREGMQTLQAMVALGEYLTALSSKDESAKFTVHMLVGADGKTNGPMLTLLALGAANAVNSLFGYLNRGGFYRKSDGVTNFSQWYDPAKKQDLYQDFAGKIIEKLDMGSAQVAALQTFTKDLLKDGGVTSAARNLAKTPQTGFNFGSSVQTATKGMQESLVRAVFDRIEAVATGQDTRVTIARLVKDINAFIGPASLKIPVGITAQGLMDMKFSKQQKKALSKGFGNLLGEAVESTMTEYYGTLIERRNALNKTVQASFHIYNEIYQDLREQEMSRLMDEGEVAFREETVNKKTGEKRRVPLHDMTIAEEKALIERVKPLLPIAHTAYSKAEGNLNAGVLMAKSIRTKGSADYFGVKVQMGKRYKNSVGWVGSHVLATGMDTIETNPGVAALAYFMHSLDSTVMHRSIAGTETMNVHDEAANGADKINKTAGAINAKLWSTVLHYSPTTEALDLLSRTVTSSLDLLKSGDISPSTLNTLGSMLRSTLPSKKDAEWNRKSTSTTDLAKAALSLAKSNQYDAEIIRLTAMSQMTAIDQYTWEGGEYLVTGTDRAEAKALLEAHLKAGPGLDAALEKAATEFGKLLTEAGVAKPKGSKEAVVEQEPELKAGMNLALMSDGQTMYGTMGPWWKAPYAALHDFFEDTPKISIKGLATKLADIYRTDSKLENREFNFKLLQALQKVIAPNTKVEYINQMTDGRGLPKGAEQTAGFYYPKTNTIYTKSPEFLGSALVPELVLHELIHAATFQVIEKTPGKYVTRGEELVMEYENTAVGKALTDLSELLENTKEFISRNRKTFGNTYDNATENIHELVAWGMTNQGFQKDVLSKIEMKPRQGVLASGMETFINALCKLIGIQDAGGLQTLVTSVAMLLEESSNQVKREVSKKEGAFPMAAPRDPISPVESYSTMDIFNAIDNGTLDSSFQDHLRNLLGGIVEKIHGPFGSFKEAMRKSEAGNPLAVWLKALETGKAPFASSILASGFTGTSQQDFAMEQVEATVRAALNANEAFTREAYRDLAGLYTETQARLKASDFLGGDWKTNTMAEAQAMYDFVFKLDKSNGDRSDYLARFAALGLAHQGFNKLLQAPTGEAAKAAPKSFAARVQKIFEDILEFFHNKYTHTYRGQPADQKLAVLVEQLVHIEAKKRHVLAKESNILDQINDKVEEEGEKFVRVAHRTITKIMGNKAVRNHSSAFVRGAFSLARGITRSRIDGTLQAMIAFRDSQTKGIQGLAAGLITNVKTPQEAYLRLLLATKKNEKIRKDEITHIGKFALESFVNTGRDMTKQAKAAVTSVFLRTGAHVLLDHMDMNGIEELLSNKAVLDKTIASFEDKLTEFGNLKDLYIEDANGLGYWKATGINRVLFMKTNATQIAKRFGSPAPSLTDAQVASATATINALVTLYALKYTSAGTKTEANNILSKENARPDTEGNGVEYALLLAKNLEVESLARLFDGNPAQMVHGFTPEIYNYNTVLTTANEAEGIELLHLGYSKGAQVPTDPADPDKEVKHMYRLSDGGMAPHLTGVIGYYGTQAKGSNVHSGYMNAHTATGANNQQTASAILSSRNQAQQRVRNIRLPANRDMSKEQGSYMAPIYNESGDITNWRYLMAESTKDTMLERTNDFDKILGTLAGTVIGKPSTIEQNREAVKVMLDQYTNEYATRGKDYIKIGPKSADAELRDMWHLLPNETKEDIREIWGSDEISVRSDALDILFGYRKLSAADMFKRANEERKNRTDAGLPTGVMTLNSINLPQKAMVAGMEWVLRMYARGRNMSPDGIENYAKRAAKYAAMGEKGWQELVHETKDILIVKSGITLAGNILSNFSMLYLQGVPVADMVTSTLTAFRGATAYQHDNAELQKLRTGLEIGRTLGQDAQMKRRILVLEDAIARNPVSKLIDAGLMPTIVEDLAAEEDTYSYKSALTRKVDGLTSKMNPTAVRLARNMYMAHDTKMYQGLSHITQLSDFVARYALYQHQTTRKKNPLTEKEAILRASEAFVNYDIPMHRVMQYTDDMGFTMFTKYFLYIQREIWRAGREHPARLYSMMLLNNYMSLGPIVLESSMLSKFGNDPFRSGALGFPGSLDRLMTVKAALAIVK